MSTKPEFKVGDRVRRLTAAGAYPAGWEFTVTRIGENWDGEHSLYDKSVVHYSRNCELVLTPFALELRAAEAEVERIKAEIEKANAPKIGDTYTTGTSIAKVAFIGRHFIVLQQIDDGSWNKGKDEWAMSAENLKKNWTKRNNG